MQDQCTTAGSMNISAPEAVSGTTGLASCSMPRRPDAGRSEVDTNTQE